MKRSQKGQASFFNRCSDTMPKFLTKEESTSFFRKAHNESEGRSFEATIKCASNELLFVSHDNFKSDAIKNNIVVDEINVRLLMKRDRDICFLDHLVEP